MDIDTLHAQLHAELDRQDTLLAQLPAAAARHADVEVEIDPALDGWVGEQLAALRARPAPAAPRFALRA